MEEAYKLLYSPDVARLLHRVIYNLLHKLMLMFLVKRGFVMKHYLVGKGKHVKLQCLCQQVVLWL